MNPDNGVGPPEKERPGGYQAARPDQKSATTTDKLHDIAPPPRCPAETLAGLRRRRLASYRLPPLDCGCRDSWPCRCKQPPLSTRALDGWVAAARHILAVGEVPLLPLEVLCALWRRGGHDRALAEQLHAATGGQVT